MGCQGKGKTSQGKSQSADSASEASRRSWFSGYSICKLQELCQEVLPVVDGLAYQRREGAFWNQKCLFHS